MDNLEYIFYGGFVDDNINNENCKNVYLLIYERKKKTPIKIVIEKENEEKYFKMKNIKLFLSLRKKEIILINYMIYIIQILIQIRK